MTNFQKIRKLAVALYGDRWQHAVARDLGVHHRQVVRWVSGDYQPSEAHVSAMVTTAKNRISDIGKALAMVAGEDD